MDSVKALMIASMLLILLGSSACTKQEIKDITNNVVSKGEAALSYSEKLTTNESFRIEQKINLSTHIAYAITNAQLQQISAQRIQTYEEYQRMVENVNLALNIVKERTGVSVKPLSKEWDAYQKFLTEVQRYAPLIDNYNELLVASYNFNPNDVQSTDLIVEKTTGFVAEAVLLIGGAFYKFAYLTVGNFAHYLGLTKLSALCSSCVSAAMSSGHWIVRNGAVERASEAVARLV